MVLPQTVEEATPVKVGPGKSRVQADGAVVLGEGIPVIGSGSQASRLRCNVLTALIRLVCST